MGFEGIKGFGGTGFVGTDLGDRGFLGVVASGDWATIMASGPSRWQRLREVGAAPW